MKRAMVYLVFLFLLTACGAAPQEVLPMVVTVTAGDIQPLLPELETPLGSAADVLPTPTLPATPIPTSTALPTPIPSPTLEPAPTLEPSPTLTETMLPPLDLPTERPFEPNRRPWLDVSTYPADSEPGWMFRLDYDPDLWAETEGNYGEFVLAHRNIPYCVISSWVGRGLPPDWRAEHDFRAIGSYFFDVTTVTYQGEIQFVAYVGGDKHVTTGFQVDFETDMETCITDSEKLLTTFRAVFATPTVTPIPTLEATPTP